MNSASNLNPKILVACVASPHAGYLKLFRAYQGGRLYILGEEFTKEHVAFRRFLPGLMSYDACTMVRALHIFSSVEVLTKDGLSKMPLGPVAMPEEDTSHVIAEKYFSDREVFFDSRWKLRWDWGNSQKNESPPIDRAVSSDGLAIELMHRATVVAECSSDWWRQVGCLLAREGEVLITAFNKHMPSEQSAYLLGDPRSNFEQGVAIEVSIASHAERRVMAEAARLGIKTEGCDLYVTTFPCPPCAYAWAESGIRRLYYRDGYSLVEGAAALKSAGIEMIQVIVNSPRAT